jgi:glycosyltransferase involved in cell wall biosynthesis
MRTISAVLIVRNEEAHLEECLQSLRGVADEIVVVDTGSTDDTIAIADRYTHRRFKFRWVNDFAAARNFALDQATGDYALTIDADERVAHPAMAGAKLQAFVRGQDEQVVGTVEIENFAGVGPVAQVTVDNTERFFSRRLYRYTGAIHEQLVAREGEKRSAPSGVRLLHLGYAQRHDDPGHKAHRNKALLLHELELYPDDEYYRYQLGKAHYSLREYAEATWALEKALQAIRFEPGAPPMGRLGPVAREVLTDLVVTLGYAYVNTGQLEKAADHLAFHAELAHPGIERADFHHVRGYIFLMLGDIAQSRAAYEESLRLGAGAEDVLGTGSFASAYHLGLLSEAEHDVPAALGHYLQALDMKPDYPVALSRCVDLVIEYQSALPPEVWARCNHDAFSRIYLERLDTNLENGAADTVRLLVQAAGAMAPELLERCKLRLQDFTARDS